MATVQEHLAAISQAGQTDTEHVARDYHQAIVDTTDGVERDPSEVAKVLAAAGKTVADLEHDCLLLEKRRNWARLLDEAPEHDRLAGELQQKASEVAAELQRTKAKLEAELHDLCLRRDCELNFSAGAGQTRQELIRTAWPHQKGKVAALRAELESKCGGHIAELEEYIHTKESILLGAQRQVESTGPKAPTAEMKDYFQRQAIGCKEAILEATERLNTLKATRDDILARLAEAEKELLVP